MQQMRLDSKDGLANGWAGAGIGDAMNLPDRVRAQSPSAVRVDDGAGDGAADDAAEQSGKRNWIGTTLRLARNAIAGLLVIMAVPVAIVGLRSHYLGYYEHVQNDERIQLVERLRPLMLPKDASITPMQAGLAFSALQPVDRNELFPRVTAATVPTAATTAAVASTTISASAPSTKVDISATAPEEWPWRKHKLSPGMFKSAGPSAPAFSGPSPDHIIEVTPWGFSASELAYLREIAEAPLWKNYDLVAAANAVDMVGGRFQLPFKTDAFAPQMPRALYPGTKELAYASMSRAAYFLAIGERAKSEAALRATVSFGFAMIDNANSTIDATIGAVIVNIGRSGLAQLLETATHFPNDLVSEVRIPKSILSDPLRVGKRVSAEELQRRLISEANNPALPRGVRMEQLSQLSMASCRNISGMISGPTAETRAAFNNARKSLARYPSEIALLNMIEDESNRVPDKDRIDDSVERFVMGAALVASTVTGNERFSTCTRAAISYW